MRGNIRNHDEDARVGRDGFAARIRPFRRAHPRRGLIAFILAILLFCTAVTTASADSGYATWYGSGFQGNEMYYGGTFDMYDPTTAASNMYPFGTWIEVTNPANGRSVIVQVRDRGAFSYALDLSYAAFKKIADPALMGIPISYHVVSGPNGDPTPAPAPKAAPSSSGASGGTAKASASNGSYTVQSGDTLNDIADQSGVDAQKIIAWNNLTNPDLLVVGSTIRLSPPPAPAKVAPSSATYLIQTGDTLTSIAERYSTTADALVRLNNLADPNSIAPGQSIAVPATAPAPRTYVVQPGDTLTSIASAYGLSPSALATANNLADPNAIQPGATLVIPGV